MSLPSRCHFHNVTERLEGKPKMPISKSNDQSFTYFSAFPREIRDKIWAECLPDQRLHHLTPVLNIQTRSTPTPAFQSNRKIYLVTLCVNRESREETLRHLKWAFGTWVNFRTDYFFPILHRGTELYMNLKQLDGRRHFWATLFDGEEHYRLIRKLIITNRLRVCMKNFRDSRCQWSLSLAELPKLKQITYLHEDKYNFAAYPDPWRAPGKKEPRILYRKDEFLKYNRPRYITEPPADFILTYDSRFYLTPDISVMTWFAERFKPEVEAHYPSRGLAIKYAVSARYYCACGRMSFRTYLEVKKYVADCGLDPQTWRQHKSTFWTSLDFPIQKEEIRRQGEIKGRRGTASARAKEKWMAWTWGLRSSFSRRLAAGRRDVDTEDVKPSDIPLVVW
jgi:hypothetical protein